MLNKIKTYILRQCADYYIDKRNEYYFKARDYYDAHEFDEAFAALDKVHGYDEKWNRVALKLMGADA